MSTVTTEKTRTAILAQKTIDIVLFHPEPSRSADAAALMARPLLGYTSMIVIAGPRIRP